MRNRFFPTFDFNSTNSNLTIEPQRGPVTDDGWRNFRPAGCISLQHNRPSTTAVSAAGVTDCHSPSGFAMTEMVESLCADFERTVVDGATAGS